MMILFIEGIMAVWLVAGIATTIFIVLYDTEDFRERLNMMQPPELPYKLTVIGCMVINLLFCYIWEVSRIGVESISTCLQAYSNYNNLRATKKQIDLLLSIGLCFG